MVFFFFFKMKLLFYFEWLSMCFLIVDFLEKNIYVLNLNIEFNIYIYSK